ncbi:MAG: sodium-dependent bicarbonate transport family permease [Brevundimonas sp.]|uniref:sodium-dependent bicarbonate transport family permease n=1 Tax=Brevundimonas sp. TaxID=1871086 RepID=UPI00391C98F2
MHPAFEFLTSPAILFFVVGMIAALARSDLALPEPVTRALSLYLMLCIGFKGGVEARAAGLSADFATAAVLGVVFSALVPLLAYGILKRITRLDRQTLCAMAATYGSVSVVTFAAGQQHLDAGGAVYGGYMAAVLAIMETPAILTALILMNGERARSHAGRGKVLHEVFTNAAAVLLIGSFVVGLISGQRGMARLDVFVGPLFQGALCFFLLEMGLVAARRLMSDGRRLSTGVVGFAIAFPVLCAGLGMVAARAAGLGAGDGALFAILCGSASYIAVPAAMKVAAPGADTGVYVTASIALTFPFNLLAGIPLYVAVAGVLW